MSIGKFIQDINSEKFISTRIKPLTFEEKEKIDTIIIGGGISGLNIAVELCKKKHMFTPEKKLLILEQNDFVGGLTSLIPRVDGLPYSIQVTGGELISIIINELLPYLQNESVIFFKGEAKKVFHMQNGHYMVSYQDNNTKENMEEKLLSVVTNKLFIATGMDYETLGDVNFQLIKQGILSYHFPREYFSTINSDKKVCIIGRGNYAVKAALSFLDVPSHITLLLEGKDNYEGQNNPKTTIDSFLLEKLEKNKKSIKVYYYTPRTISIRALPHDKNGNISHITFKEYMKEPLENSGPIKTKTLKFSGQIFVCLDACHKTNQELFDNYSFEDTSEKDELLKTNGTMKYKELNYSEIIKNDPSVIFTQDLLKSTSIRETYLPNLFVVGDSYVDTDAYFLPPKSDNIVDMARCELFFQLPNNFNPLIEPPLIRAIGEKGQILKKFGIVNWDDDDDDDEYTDIEIEYTDIQADIQTNIPTDIQSDIQTNTPTNIQADIQTGIPTDIQFDIQTDPDHNGSHTGASDNKEKFEPFYLPEEDWNFC